MKKAGFDQAVITFDLRYFNPNKFHVQLRKAEVDIYFNNKFLGNSTLDTVIDIPKRDTFSVPVSMQIKLKDAFSNAVQLLLNPNVMVKLNGNARVSKGAITMNVPITYEGMKRIDLLGRDSASLK
ncbi:MAG TPA: LEA type 2 family protein [Chitinophagaceae bacterium]